MSTYNAEAWQLERRGDGSVLVRVPSRETPQGRLPDAVFAFNCGDPQFDYWDALLREQPDANRGLYYPGLRAD